MAARSNPAASKPKCRWMKEPHSGVAAAADAAATAAGEAGGRSLGWSHADSELTTAVRARTRPRPPASSTPHARPAASIMRLATGARSSTRPPLRVMPATRASTSAPLPPYGKSSTAPFLNRSATMYAISGAGVAPARQPEITKHSRSRRASSHGLVTPSATRRSPKEPCSAEREPASPPGPAARPAIPPARLGKNLATERATEASPRRAANGNEAAKLASGRRRAYSLLHCSRPVAPAFPSIARSYSASEVEQSKVPPSWCTRQRS